MLFAPSLDAQPTDISSEDGAPLSVIEWLDTVQTEAAIDPSQAEPPIVESGSVPSVEALPLEDAGGGGLGLLPMAVSGLPTTMWQGAGGDAMTAALTALPSVLMSPLADLRTRLLLAEATAPVGMSSEGFLATRVDSLLAFGAVSEAQALLNSAGPIARPLFSRAMDIALLTASEDAVCQSLAHDPSLSDDLPTRVFCLARLADWSAAALTLRTASALGDIEPGMAALLEQFLEPEFADEANPPLPAGAITPLTIRLREAMGAPLATQDLARAFAVVDLRPELGWKAQLDAAERLARSGAVQANQLFGIYSARIPAASGGVWDRAEAIQRLDAALSARDPTAIGSALQSADELMSDVGLRPILATLVAPRLDPRLPLGTAAAAVRNRLLLLSPRYEDVRGDTLEAALGAGDTNGHVGQTPLETALIAGFDGSTEPERAGGIAMTILRAIAQIEAARSADLSALPQALATLRALGLEETARRSALHLLLDT